MKNKKDRFTVDWNEFHRRYNRIAGFMYGWQRAFILEEIERQIQEYYEKKK